MLNLTQENFQKEVVEADTPVLVEFSEKSELPNDLTEQYLSRCKFCHVDVKAQTDFANQFSLLSLPTSILMQKGEILQRISGKRSNEEWKRILNLE